MLERLRIQNFKSWQDTGDMAFGSLTGFFGTNSSGKSSILQFLAFYQWALQNHRNSQRCELVTLALADDGSFAAFPTAAELAKFDPADRKFVAAALAHPANPPVVNATDKDWHEHHVALRSNGVRVEFVCVEEMTRPRQ